jgi:sugar lactone lactonase YvrE
MALGVALAFLLLGLSAGAAGPVFWQTSTRSDFLKGDVENLSIDHEGRLLLGPAVQVVHDSNSPFLWALIAAPDGSHFVGSGNEGKVYKVDKAGTWSSFYDAPELEVHALALAPGGGLYVGTSPQGKIYKLDAKGTATPFFDPKEKYIWALAADAKGNLFAATGDKGVIYRITADGKGEVFYRTKATHVVSMAFDRDGNLVAGTESPGMVFRIDPQGKAFVLMDSPFREIHAVRVDDEGTIYAAGVGAKQSPEDRTAPESITGAGETTRPAAVPSVSTEITAISMIDVASLSGTSDTKGTRREERRAAKGGVYRIMPDGTNELVWESPDDSPYDLLLEPAGTLLIGTGGKGKIYRVTLSDPPRVTLLARAPAQQVTQMLAGGAQGVLLASANPGKLFRMSTRQADRGTYVSDVHDSQTLSAWGTISWRATTPRGSQLQVFTRSGNSQIPDDTWSAWSDAYSNADGQPMTSPKARFLQWKAVMGGTDSPVLTSVTAAYLQKNVRPRVTSITVYPPGVVFQKPFSTGEAEIAGFDDTTDTRPQTSGNQPTSLSSTVSSSPAMGRRVYQKGLQAFVWKAEDDNDDKLQYDVLYRRDDETTWRALRRGLTDPIFVWDTTSVPNGTYTVRVVASDAPSNPPGTAQTGEMDSTTFDIDNTPPVIRVTGVRREAKRVVLLFEVRDDQSAVQRVDFSIDAERWRAIYPKDGIADSRFEQYELPLDSDAQLKTLVIRAMDAMNNVATARGEIPKG